MTPKQQRFVEEYLIDCNATGAYLRAGYRAKGHVAEVNASRLLRNAEIQRALQAATTARSERTELTADWVISRLRENAERAMQIRPVLDAEGNKTGIYQYEGAVANKALELLGKHLGIFKERIEHTTPGSAPPNFFLMVQEHAIELRALADADKPRNEPVGPSVDQPDGSEPAPPGLAGIQSGTIPRFGVVQLLDPAQASPSAE